MDTGDVVVVSGSYGAGHDAAEDALARDLRTTGRVVRRLDVVDELPWGTGRLLRWAYFTQLRLAALRELCVRYDYPVALADTGIEAFLEARSTVELFAEVDAVLRELGARFRLAALTNGNTDLARAGVSGYFEFALSPAETGVSKPDPRMFEAMLARAEVPAGAVVHVGDEPYYDIEGAHRANVRSVWVNRNAREWPTEYRRAHAEITTLEELPAVLAQLTGG
mgnify:CR=1 FL=1